MLALRGVTVRQKDQASGIVVESLRDVSLMVGEGEAVALLGPSGAGKTTLLSVAAGVVRAGAGDVRVAGRDVTAGRRSWDAWLRSIVGVAFQFPERGFFAATVREEVGLTPSMLGWSARETEAAVERALTLVGLSSGFLSRSPFRLSGGEKRRVALAAAVAHRPRLLLLDEPEVGLDLEGRRRVEALIKALKREGAAVVVATHDVGAALTWADRCVILDGGSVSGVIDTGAGLSAHDMERLFPYLWDGELLATLRREAGRSGWELPDPYLATDDFLAALMRAHARPGDKQTSEPEIQG